ncbi:MAG TPA: GNAT family N-acetyltransferase [Ktedonobacterales bacterium]
MITTDMGRAHSSSRMSIALLEREAATAALRVVPVDPSRDWRWEQFLSQQPDATLYHHPLWLQLLHDAFGCQPAHLLCEDGQGHVRGILPLFSTMSLLTGRRFSSLPRSPIGGPLALDHAATKELLTAAVERVREDRGAQLQLKVQGDELSGVVDDLVGGPFRPTYVLTLPPADQQMRFGDAKRRHRIKGNVDKAARNGIRVREGESLADLRAWHQLYLQTMRRRFVPPRPYAFFERAWELLRPAGILRLWLAEQHTAAQTQLVAGGVFLGYNGVMSYAFQGSREEALDLRPNDALQWHAILDAHRLGYRAYDMGEVSQGNASLAAYKEKWGCERRWLYRYYYGTFRERELELLDSQSRWRTLAGAAWQHVPLSGTELISTWLHRHT